VIIVATAQSEEDVLGDSSRSSDIDDRLFEHIEASQTRIRVFALDSKLI